MLPIDVFVDAHTHVRRLGFDLDICTTEGDVSVGLKFDFLSYGPQTVPGLPHGDEVRDATDKFKEPGELDGPLAVQLLARPRLKLRQGINRVAGLVQPPAVDPDLEVQVRARGVAGLADMAQLLALDDRLAGRHGDARMGAVGEEERVAVGGVLDHVVARRAGLVAGRVD